MRTRRRTGAFLIGCGKAFVENRILNIKRHLDECKPIHQNTTKNSDTFCSDVLTTTGDVICQHSDGFQSAASDAQTFPNINPTTEEVIANVPIASSAEVDQAIQAARVAFDSGDDENSDDSYDELENAKARTDSKSQHLDGVNHPISVASPPGPLTRRGNILTMFLLKYILVLRLGWYAI